MQGLIKTIITFCVVMLLASCTSHYCSPYCRDSERYNPGRIDNACVSFCVDTHHSLDQCNRDCKR